MNNIVISLIISIFFGAATLPLFLYLTRKVSGRKDEFRTAIADAYTQTYWPALSSGAPSRWELIWRWAGWSRAVPSLKKLVLFFFLLFLILIFTVGSAYALLLAMMLIFGYINLARLAKKKRQIFEKQLPDALIALIDTLRSGFSLSQAVKFVAEELSPPIQFVFKALARAGELNLDFAESLRRISLQLDNLKWAMVSEALIAQSKLGGNIIPLLEEASRAIRDEQAVNEDIKTLTAAGRMSGFLIAGLVPVVLIFFWLASPSYVGAMFTTALGRTLLAIALALETVAFFWIKKIIKVDY